MNLTQNEIRVLGTLCEKQRTVPDTYPLSLNALLAGCNQKTSRQPVLELTESDVAAALDRLKELRLVNEVSGSRVARYAHQFEKTVAVSGPAAALLTVLMLRGPQTAGELRLNCERLYSFADISSVEAFLEELTAREPALVRELPRAPGARENRWGQLLGGDDFSDFSSSTVKNSTEAGELATLQARVAALEQEVGELRSALQELLAAR
ncbi:YceH family protein [Dechloromonas sp. ZY10]|uniref:YceH family protein n=1 Tax=Dechloromonas aquae TaxID=2664436 RepID=UPI00352783DC